MKTLTLSDEQLVTIAHAIEFQMSTIAAHAGRCLADSRRAEAMGDAGEYDSWFEGPKANPLGDAFAKYLHLGAVLNLVYVPAGLAPRSEDSYRNECMVEAERIAGPQA